MSQYEFLEKHKWVRPDSYAGFNPEGDTLLCHKHRDAQIVTESNWDKMLEKLLKVKAELPLEMQEPEASLATEFGCFGAQPAEVCRERWVYVWRASCSMFGFHDYMMLRSDAPDELKRVADDILHNLDGYPILDEDDYGARTDVAIHEFWKEASESERQHYHQEAGVDMEGDGEEMPDQVYDQLRDSEMFY